MILNKKLIIENLLGRNPKKVLFFSIVIIIVFILFFRNKYSTFDNIDDDIINKLLTFLYSQKEENYYDYVKFLASNNNTNMNLEKNSTYYYLHGLVKDKKLSSSDIKLRS